MAKTILLPDMVCKVEKSGNRYNAYNTSGVKMTSEITTGCRKNAFNGDYLLGRFPSTNGNKGSSWRRVTDKGMSELENSSVLNSSSNEVSSDIEVPTDHAEVLAFIHNSFR